MKSLLIPHPDKIVPDETGKRIPPEGVRATLNRYWRRRIAAGDVSLGKAPRTPEHTAFVASVTAHMREED